MVVSFLKISPLIYLCLDDLLLSVAAISMSEGEPIVSIDHF